MFGKTLKVRVGDSEFDVQPGFRLYLTTKMANPHFSPEHFARSTVIDFTVMAGGLEDQLLDSVMVIERHELEEQRRSLVQEIAANKQMVKVWAILMNYKYALALKSLHQHIQSCDHNDNFINEGAVSQTCHSAITCMTGYNSMYAPSLCLFLVLFMF